MRLPIFTILGYLAVLIFFMLSIGAVLYVVFFQVVVAAELRDSGAELCTPPGFEQCGPLETALWSGSGVWTGTVESDRR